MSAGVSHQAGSAGSERRYHVLDGVRGIAAFVVVLYHYLIDPTKYPFVSNSYIAVDLFFILSGFVIYHTYAAKIRGGMKAGVFVNLRFARLAPTVAAGVVLGAIATLAFYRATGQTLDPVRFALDSAGNVLFIPDVLDYDLPLTGNVSLFPSNHPLWSIFFEFIASLCFIWLVRLPKWILIAGSFAMFCVMVSGCIYLANGTDGIAAPAVGWSWGTFLLGFPRLLSAFMGGMMICALTQDRASGAARLLPVSGGLIPTLALYAATLVVLMFPFKLSNVYPFIAIAVFCPLLIAAGSRMQPKSRWLVTASDWLGQLSFPLYCVHVPVRTLVQSVVGDGFWMLQIIVSIILSVLLSMLLLRLLDRSRARHRVSSILKPITG